MLFHSATHSRWWRRLWSPWERRAAARARKLLLQPVESMGRQMSGASVVVGKERRRGWCSKESSREQDLSAGRRAQSWLVVLNGHSPRILRAYV